MASLFLVYTFSLYIICFSAPSERINTDICKHYPTITLPRIDVSKYTNGSIQEKEEIVQLFKESLHKFGSLSLYNHGIAPKVIKQMEVSGNNFFKKQQEYKRIYNSNGLGTPGYEPLLSLAASAAYGESNNDGDYTEMYAMFNHIAGSNTYNTYYPLQDKTPNELYNISREYIPEIRRVLGIVHNMASDALFGININSNYFENIYSETPHFQLRWLNYPNIEDDISNLTESGKFAISPHKDYLGFTLFHPGKQRGLQNKIGGTNGVWIDCEIHDENDIFINTGELFDIWTNGYWKANWHRVILHNQQRITFSYFTGPNNDEIIKPIDGCIICNEENPKYASRTAAEHALLRFTKSDLINSEGLKFFTD